MCRGVRGGVWRSMEGCAEGCKGGTQRCMETCTEVCGGAQKCTDVHGGGGEKNKDVMLIRFLNASILLDVVGTFNQSESCMEVCRGV